MLKRWFSVVGVSAILLVLMTSGTSHAQLGGFWGGWGTMSPWSGTGGVTYWPGGIGANYIPGIYNRAGYGGLGYNGMGMGMGAYPVTPYGFAPNSMGMMSMNSTAYYPPVYTSKASLIPPPMGLLPINQPAIVEVLAPADAVVTFDGRATSQTGEHRIFMTPQLIKGDSYHYTVEATFVQDGKKVTQKQRVPVYAGGRATAVFPTTK